MVKWLKMEIKDMGKFLKQNREMAIIGGRILFKHFAKSEVTLKKAKEIFDKEVSANMSIMAFYVFVLK